MEIDDSVEVVDGFGNSNVKRIELSASSSVAYVIYLTATSSRPSSKANSSYRDIFLCIHRYGSRYSGFNQVLVQRGLEVNFSIIIPYDIKGSTCDT